MPALAPIGVSTYTRLRHLTQTIEALKQNSLAEKSNLYIFSDAPKMGDEQKVARVREYLRSIDGFKNVNIIQRKKNGRVFNNRDGIRFLLEKYGKIIFLEEDIVTAPGFLEFMNEALRFFENDENIFSVTGYCPPIQACEYCSDDFFVLPRFNAWGFAIWKNKYELIQKISKREFKKFLENKKAVKDFLRSGDDTLRLSYLDAYGIIDALDVKAMFRQFALKQYTIYPRRSLTLNIGNDGTGLHCGKTTKYNVQLWDQIKFKFDNKIKIDPRILKSNQNFRSLGAKGVFSKILVSLGLFLFVKRFSNFIRSK